MAFTEVLVTLVINLPSVTNPRHDRLFICLIVQDLKTSDPEAYLKYDVAANKGILMTVCFTNKYSNHTTLFT